MEYSLYSCIFVNDGARYRKQSWAPSLEELLKTYAVKDGIMPSLRTVQCGAKVVWRKPVDINTLDTAYLNYQRGVGIKARRWLREWARAWIAAQTSCTRVRVCLGYGSGEHPCDVSLYVYIKSLSAWETLINTEFQRWGPHLMLGMPTQVSITYDADGKVYSNRKRRERALKEKSDG